MKILPSSQFCPRHVVFPAVVLLCCSSSYANIGNQSEESWYQDKLIARDVEVPGWWERQTTEAKSTGRVQICPVLPNVTNFDSAAMQLRSLGDKLRLSKTIWEKMPKSSLCPCRHTLHWNTKHMGGIKGNICKQRDQQLLSSAPSWPPVSLWNSKEIIWWTHQHLKASYMPIKEICEEFVQKKYKR